MMRNTGFDYIRTGGYAGIMMPIFLFIMILSGILVSPWFSFTDNALSDLGVSAESAALFNVGLIVSGLLSLIFGAGLFIMHKNEKNYKKEIYIRTASVLFFMLCSFFLSGIGIFTLDSRYMHLVNAGGFFILCPLSILVFGLSFYRDKKKMIRYIVFAGLSWSAWLIPWPGEGIALPEIWAVIFIFAFIITESVNMIRKKYNTI